MNPPTPSLAARITRGDPLYGLIVKMPSPVVVEQAGYAGFDLVVIDTEHGMADNAELEHHLRAADSVGIPVLVRIGTNDPLLTLRALDAGATGVIVPHVSNAEDARAAVCGAHYHPSGTRGLAVSTRAGHHGAKTVHQHISDASATTVVVGQVEDNEAVQHSREIAETAGLNAVWIGPSDLSLSLGLPGQPEHPAVVAAIEQIATAVVASPDCALCVLVDSPEEAADWHARGAKIVLFNSSAIHARELRAITTAVRSIAPPARVDGRQ